MSQSQSTQISNANIEQEKCLPESVMLDINPNITSLTEAIQLIP